MKLTLSKIIGITMILVSFATFLGCKQNSRIAVPSNDCTKITNQIEQLIKDNKNDSLVSQELQKIYYSTPEECRYSAAYLIFRNLFLIAYKNPEADSTILPFLIEQGENNSNDLKTRVTAFFTQASYYLYILHSPDSGFKSLQKATIFEKEFDDTLAKSYVTLMAQSMLQKGDLQSAAENYTKAISYNEKLKDSNSLMGNIGNLAVVYSEMKEFEKSIPLRRKSIEYYESKGDDTYTFIGLVGLGSTYGNLGNRDSALANDYRSLDLLKKGVVNPVNEYILYINMGQIYLNNGNIDSAIHYFDLAKILVNKIGSKDRLMSFMVYSTPAYAGSRDVSEEVQLMKEYTKDLLKDNDLISARDTWNTLYTIAKIQKKPKETLDAYLIYDSIDDVLSSNANKKYINELQTKFETQKKEAKIQLQQKEINKNSSLINILIALLIACIFGTGFVIYLNRLKKNKQQVLQQQQFTTQFLEKSEAERSRIARDLHDVLSQELLVLKNKLIIGHKINPADIDVLTKEVEIISKNIHPIILEQMGFKMSVLSLCNRLMEDRSLSINCHISYRSSLPKGAELQLFRIIQEGLNNIVKYAKATKVKVSIFPKDGNLIIQIQDNGIGFDVQETLQGSTAFGLLGIYERSRAINVT
jgi:tetratricopeptide (TPR) repeat protein